MTKVTVVFGKLSLERVAQLRGNTQRLVPTKVYAAYNSSTYDVSYTYAEHYELKLLETFFDGIDFNITLDEDLKCIL